MKRLQAFVDALNIRKNTLLLIAQSSMPRDRFEAFRKLLLRELGKDGLEREFARIIEEQDKDRNR